MAAGAAGLVAAAQQVVATLEAPVHPPGAAPLEALTNFNAVGASSFTFVAGWPLGLKEALVSGILDHVLAPCVASEAAAPPPTAGPPLTPVATVAASLETLKILAREKAGTHRLHSHGFLRLLLRLMGRRAWKPAATPRLPLAGGTLNLLFNLLLHNRPMISAFLAVQGGHALVALLSSPHLDVAQQAQAFKLVFVLSALEPSMVTLFRDDLSIITAATRALQSYRLSESPLAPDGDPRGPAIREACRSLFAVYADAWAPSAAVWRNEAPASLTERQRHTLVQYATLVAAVRPVLLVGHEAAGSVFSAVLELFVNIPPGATTCILGRPLSLEASLVFSKCAAGNSQARITERKWDPDEPGEVEEKVISEGPEGSWLDAAVEGRPKVEAAYPSFGECTAQELAVLPHILSFLEQQLDGDVDASILAPAIAPLRACSLECSGVRRFLKQRILPRRESFDMAPEHGDSMGAKLIRLLTSSRSGVAPLVGELLFALCNRNVSRLVRHCGYGNCAGVLTFLGVAWAPDAAGEDSASESSDTEADVNPITGMYFKEPEPQPEMSEEEKEYRAMELLDLINKLNKTGVMSCNLPEPADITEITDGDDEEAG